MIELALIILTHLKDQRVEPLPHPANRDVLQGQVISNFEVVRTQENLLRLLKPDAPLRVLPQSLALRPVKIKSHTKYNRYTILAGCLHLASMEPGRRNENRFPPPRSRLILIPWPSPSTPPSNNESSANSTAEPSANRPNCSPTRSIS